MEKTSTKKQKAARFRNMTYGQLICQKNAVNRLLTELPMNGVLTKDEVRLLVNLRTTLTDVIANWKYTTNHVIMKKI